MFGKSVEGTLMKNLTSKTITPQHPSHKERNMKIHHVLFTCMLICFLSTPSIAQESKTPRHAVNLPRGEAANLPFSDAVMVGNTLYISGRGGIDFKTMKTPDEPKDEAKLMLDGFKSLLAQAEMTMDDLVSVTVYCPDLSLYKVFNEVYRTYFTKDFPSRAFVGSGPLLFGMRFEMQAIAVK